MGTVIDGRAEARRVRDEVRRGVESLRAVTDRAPGLATVLVGDDAASATYVRNKRRSCEKVGIASFPHELPADTSAAAVVELVRQLNARRDVHGILVQLPLPEGIDESAVLGEITPEKDVDGLHPLNQGRLLAGVAGLRPCTPLGVMRLLDAAGTALAGASAVVVGRSQLVGKPIALLLLERHATVTLCHSRTRDLPSVVGGGDIVVAAVGRPRFSSGEWLRPGCTVIDVGINRLEDGTLVGDVDFPAALERAAAVTPVPGGVGQMTVAMLLQNTLDAARRQLGGDCG